jgi:hypothetical protein
MSTNHRFADWPMEGASLVETIERIAGPELLAGYRAARAAAPPYSWASEPWPTVFPKWWLDGSGEYQSEDAAQEIAKRVKETMRACLAPVIAAWDAGEIRATGKRRDVLADAVGIPAPTHLWKVSGVDLERSVIDDPAGGKIHDLLFHVGEPRPPMAATTWLENAVTERLHAGGTPRKSTDFARSLRKQMVADKNRGLVEKVFAMGTIRNYLREIL